jgi:hypothetical protein
MLDLFFPTRSGCLLSDLRPLLGRHPSRPRLAPHAPQRHGGGVLATLGGCILNLAGRDPHDVDRVADYIGGALLAFRASWHSGNLMLGGKLGKIAQAANPR